MSDNLNFQPSGESNSGAFLIAVLVTALVSPCDVLVHFKLLSAIGLPCASVTRISWSIIACDRNERALLPVLPRRRHSKQPEATIAFAGEFDVEEDEEKVQHRLKEIKKQADGRSCRQQKLRLSPFCVVSPAPPVLAGFAPEVLRV
jgi:hypothetical protein